MMFSPVASPPNCSDLERGRRPGNRADFRDFLKLGQTFNILHLTGGYTVEPIDIPPDIRHLEALRDIYTLTDKPTHSYSLGWGRIRDGIEMCRIARGIDRAQLEREPSLMTIINTSSPLRLDSPMAAGIIEMARAGQIVVLTPFTLAGAMAPVTVAGAVAQQNAEALLGIALAQLVRPGAPVIYGGFTSNVDMKSGAPAFGTPEYMKAVLLGGQLARRYRPALPHLQHHAPPTRSTARRCTSRCSRSGPWSWAAATWSSTRRAGSRAGLCSSFEKLVIDVDTLQMVASFLEPLQVDEFDPGAGCHPRGRPGRAFLRLRAHPGPLPHAPSTRRSSPTGATTRAGARPARPTPPATPTASTRRSWPPTSRRRSTRRSRRSWTPSSNAGSAKAARPASSERWPIRCAAADLGY